jgi:phosphoribosyl-AMP cyclohydrolase
MVELDFSKMNGLVTAVAVDAKDGEVLMVAYMNEEAFSKTLETGKVHYYSRSRDKLWLKGESSGNVQVVKEIRVDCDRDAIVIRIEQSGPACHEGFKSCFFRTVGDDAALVENQPRLKDPAEMYGGKK